VRSASNAIVYPWLIVKGVASASHRAQRIAGGPTPLTGVLGLSVPQLGQTPATNGSPWNRPSIGRSVPEAVASDVTVMSRMRRAIASPISAPATATGLVTSCPPRMQGGDHRPPAPGGGVGDDVPAVPHGPQHRPRRIENAVGELVNQNRLATG